MNNDMKKAFDGIHAEEKLKQNTLNFLQSKMEQKEQKHPRTGFRRLAVALACFMVLTFTGLFSYNTYFTEAMYVDVDINPSIELTVNRFDRVIGVYAYNADGEELLAGLDLMHMPCDGAVTMLTEAAIQNGFLSDGGLVSVTLQSNNVTGNDVVLQTLETNITSTAQGHHSSVQVDVFSVDSDTRTHAHEQNLSPAKYLAILALQEVDPTATVEGCRDHTVEEIYTMTEEHGGTHHGENDTVPSENEAPSDDGAVSTESPDSHDNGHHGNGHD